MLKIIPKARVLIVLLGVFLLIACGSPTPPRYALLGGGTIDLNELHGKIVLINYWAQWCHPCRVEIPELNGFAKHYPEAVRVLSVNFDGVNGESLHEQVTALGIEFDTLLGDPRGYLAVPESGGLPETIVLNPNGKVQQVLLGPQNRESLEALLTIVPL